MDCIDIEKTDGRDFIISRHYISKDNSANNPPASIYNSTEFSLFKDDSQILYYFEEDETDTINYGKRKFLDDSVAFGDDDYMFVSRGNGQYEGLKNKKYYQAGICLKVDSAVGLGIVLLGYSSNQDGSVVDYKLSYNDSTQPFAQIDRNHNNIKSDYIVLRDTKAMWDNYGVVPVYAVISSSGKKMTKSYAVKKDGTKRYWAMGNEGTLMNIYEVPVRYRKGTGWEFESEFPEGNKVKKGWKAFGTIDEYGKTCKASKVDPGEYGLYIDDTYCANFRFAD